MFGTYRTLLAMMVVAFHIGGVPHMGGYAVFGFYVLSGYLMTLIMQENYGYTLSGIYKYAINRFLRIYPIYWMSLALSLALIFFLGERSTSSYHEAIYVPRTFIESIKNVLLFFPAMESPRLTPPAWALTVELFYYLLIGLGISRKKITLLLWLTASIAYHVVVNILDLGPRYFYFLIPAASLPFATGAFIYHYKREILKYIDIFGGAVKEYLPLVVIMLMLLNWLASYIDEQFEGIYFYLNYSICALMVAVLAERKSLKFISRNFDKWMGDLSYPIYLIHYQVALLVLVLLSMLGIHYQRPDNGLMLASLPAIFIASWMLVLMVERPIDSLRARIKKQ